MAADCYHRSTVLGTALYNLINESELLTSRSTAYPRDSMMVEFALGYGGTRRARISQYKRETKSKTETTKTSPEKNTKQKIGFDRNRTQKLKFFRSYLRLGLSNCMRLTTVGVNPLCHPTLSTCKLNLETSI